MSESPAPAAVSAGVAPATAEEHALAVDRMRRASLGALILLLVQAGLGLWVNLYCSLPDADQGRGLMASFGNAVTKGPVMLAVHAGFGMIVFFDACVVVVFAMTVRHTAVRVASVLGWLSIAGAAVAGAEFVNSGDANWPSMTMALIALFAVGCYVVNLFVLGGERG